MKRKETADCGCVMAAGHERIIESRHGQGLEISLSKCLLFMVAIY